jgi:Dynamin family
MMVELIQRPADETDESRGGPPPENCFRAEDEMRSVWGGEQLATLLPYFEWPLGDLPSEVTAALTAVASCRDQLWRAERYITMFGVFKAGKSTILNAMVWYDILPTRANRATAVVTHLYHGREPAAFVVRRRPNGQTHCEAIALHEVPHYSLLDLSQQESCANESVQEIHIQLPAPVLEGHVVLVDTPGLRDSQAMTERCRDEIAAADLAIMVLDATQILSAADRNEIARTDELLGGNLVFLVNRIDQVEPHERDSVLEYARIALASVGNDLVGRGLLFTCAAAPALRARMAAALCAGSSLPIEMGNDHGLREFERWLERLVRSGDLDRIALRSRLSLLARRLDHVHRLLAEGLADSRRSAEQLHLSEVQLADEEARRHVRAIDEDKLAVLQVRASLDQLGNMFVEAVERQAGAIIAASDGWQQRAGAAFTSPLAKYVEQVNRRVHKAVSRAHVTLPPFTLDTCGGEGITAANDKSALIGGGVGLAMSLMLFGMDFGLSTLVGPAAGAWIGKHLLGRDVKQETKDRLVAAARNAKSILRSAAEEHLNAVDKLLDTTSTCSPQRRSVLAALQAAEAQKQRFAELLEWCQRFQGEVERLRQQVVTR